MRKLFAVSIVIVAAFSDAGYPRRQARRRPNNCARHPAPSAEEEIPVPGVAGRLDHFTADAKRKRLFVSALGNNTVEVIDVFAGRVVHSIKGLAQPQGPLYVADVDKLYVANAEDGKLTVYDGATYTLGKSIDLGTDPDNPRYDPSSKRVFIGFGERMAASPCSTRNRHPGR